MEGFNIDNYLRIAPTDVILVLISTCIIILLAKKFFWSALIELIEKRQNLIQENIDSSVRMKAEAETVKAQYDEKMKNAGKEAHDIVESARELASQEKKRIVQEAQDEAARLRKQNQEDIEHDKLNAEKEMKTAIADVAMEAAKKLVEKEMDEATQKKFVDDFINQAGDKLW
ncbi:MAG: F0F1 ATP synthase subunit B [Firmicutes bacterium]|nr:F0F1 ATP synthase subunit B [Bacillota bacterium]